MIKRGVDSAAPLRRIAIDFGLSAKCNNTCHCHCVHLHQGKLTLFLMTEVQQLVYQSNGRPNIHIVGPLAYTVHTQTVLLVLKCMTVTVTT